MDRAEILAVVTRIVRAQFESLALQVAEASTVDDFPDWDSIAHVQILVALESDLGIRFSPDEFSDVGGIGDIVDRIADKLATSRADA